MDKNICVESELFDEFLQKEVENVIQHARTSNVMVYDFHVQSDVLEANKDEDSSAMRVATMSQRTGLCRRRRVSRFAARSNGALKRS
mmetsp:Transcript_18273/g.40003  ORF Transcript_18273/g.40003 Transcript_18273/m.40003 type:complete len:87 (-) Transcript_18273:127-387(-)